MTNDEKRLAEIRERYQSPKAVHILAAFADDPAIKDVRWLLDKLAERDKEIARLREMFDVTRHRMCDSMKVEHGKSWFNLGSLAAERDARIAELEHMLTGRTISCSNCNADAAKIAKLEAALREICDNTQNGEIERIAEEALK